ncbi:hypothetical protein HMPREF0541_02231 [Lacticaseibacillus rhamnosus ATCC 21052]|nr:hypothetical protein HMPREF0541_02231 [Lacticaseibacillus rhamnosus ATCC 21052]
MQKEQKNQPHDRTHHGTDFLRFNDHCNCCNSHRLIFAYYWVLPINDSGAASDHACNAVRES